MKINEIKKLTTEQINEKIAELKAELFNLRLSKATGSLEKPHRMKELRHTVARLKTVLSERNNEKVSE